jgi:LCP family protein required for cell wall assembly
MQPAHEILPRGRSPFAAAFLSLLFPGLGHAYLGAYRRGLGFAAPPLLLAALIAGFAVRMTLFDLGGLAVQPWFQVAVFVGNLVALVYRAYAIVDAWSIARALSGRPARSTTAALRHAGTLSVAGLAAVLLVMSGVHVAVARYDLLLQGTSHCIFDPDATDCGGPSESAGPGEETPSPGASATPESSIGPSVTAQPIPEWDGKQRLNILLVGVDEQGGAFNTDTMITVSIDPQTNQVVMFQLPRDTVDVPVPPGPAQGIFGAVYPGKINSYAAWANGRPDIYAGNTKNKTRGLNGLKAILGNLYGLDIKYFVEVNFDGFRKVVNALGGVTINVQVPVLDNQFPQPDGHRTRLFVPAGIQHMNGEQALEFARSRKSTSDFERAARQQRVLVSLREQVDIGAAIQNIDELAGAISQSVRTDIPVDLAPRLLGLADRIQSRAIRSVIFTPPYYQTEFLSSPRGYIIEPKIGRIRAAVADAFNVDPNFAEARDALLQEGAQVWVLNGSGRTGEAARLAQFLSYLGIDATAPNQRPDTSGLQKTTIRAYNGAEDNMPLTLAALQEAFGVEVQPVTDAAVHADFIVITGSNTPQLTPPPVP